MMITDWEKVPVRRPGGEGTQCVSAAMRRVLANASGSEAVTLAGEAETASAGVLHHDPRIPPNMVTQTVFLVPVGFSQSIAIK